jgi:hypothetical protein
MRTGWGPLWTGWRRWATGGAAALVVLPVLVIASRAGGLPGERVGLSGVTLIDGASAQVVGSVRVPGASAGDDLQVTQAGSSAYVVDRSVGSVSRVDGPTYETSEPVAFGRPGTPLSVFVGGNGLYVVDGSRRAASVTDPVSLRVRQQLSLAARPGLGQSTVDGQGRLWAVDGGGLTWFDPGKHVRDVADGDFRLVTAGGSGPGCSGTTAACGGGCASTRTPVTAPSCSARRRTRGCTRCCRRPGR